VTTAANDPHEPARTDDGPVDDVTIVPGLGPSGPLDMSQDPDRFDPARDAAAPTGPLDMSQDPDRYRPPGQGQTLTDLLGEGAQEDQRDNGQWALGLLAVIAFLALASWFFGSVVSP
jgi:hypothetical protein